MRSLTKIVLMSFALYLIMSFVNVLSQPIPNWRARLQLSDSGFVEFLQYFQIWNTITLKTPFSSSTPRFDTYIRRARFGLGGQISSKASFYASFYYDGIGKDSLTASLGNPNPEDNGKFSVRDVFFTYKFSELLNLTIGYFRPRAGKESIYTSAFNISQEKGQPSFHPRIHMVGRGIGRETGINLGGLALGNKFSLLYDLGIFDPNHPSIVGDNSIWSPLFTARILCMIGDPEMNSYQLVYNQSGMMNRKGLSIGANVTFQKRTSLFRNNMVYGGDFQLNYGSLDLLGEYLWLYRESVVNNTYFITRDNSYVIKGAWNFDLRNGQLLQFSIMHSATTPDKMYNNTGFNPHTKASLHKDFAIGVNWLIVGNRLKLGLHFVESKRHFKNNSGVDSQGIFRYINPSIQWMM